MVHHHRHDGNNHQKSDAHHHTNEDTLVAALIHPVLETSDSTGRVGPNVDRNVVGVRVVRVGLSSRVGIGIGSTVGTCYGFRRRSTWLSSRGRGGNFDLLSRGNGSGSRNVGDGVCVVVDYCFGSWFGSAGRQKQSRGEGE